MTTHNPIRILYDHRIFEMQQYGGVSRYFYEIINEFVQSSDIKPSISIAVSNNYFINKIDDQYLIPGILNRNTINKLILPDKDYSIFSKISANVKNWINYKKICEYISKNYSNTIENLQNGDFDIFHPTYYDTYFLPYLNGKPFIITVYDIIHEKYPEFYPLDDKTIYEKKILIERANHIIAISQSTKDDIIRYYNIPQERITVIHLGNKVISDETENKKDNIKSFPKKFLLYVGTRALYKNFYFMVESLAPLFKKDENLKLVCFGGEEVSKEEKYFIQNLGLKDKIIYLSGTDDLLTSGYKQAFALIYPSQYEGFGIPIIEAFKFGCPVIASNIPSIVEIGKDAVDYIEPKDPISIREAVELLLSNDYYRSELIKKGTLEAEKYSWKKTAQRTAEVYKENMI